MLLKKVRIIVILFAFIVSAIFIYKNIYSLDDFHSNYEEILETTINENSDNGNFEENLYEQKERTTEEKKKKKKPPCHIHINLDEKKMYVYKNNELIKTYPVSGGKVSTPSPEGTWVIISKDNWGEGFGGAWMGLNVPWGKYGIHGTVYPWFVGKQNASKGCIRMLNKDVKELYSIAPHGTIVSIVHENKPFRILKSGDIGSDVRDVQLALKELKYYNNWVDGKYGDGLKKCVIKFQKDNKLHANGIVNSSTYQLIMKKAEESKNASSSTVE